MTGTLAVVNCSQLVTLNGPRRPRTGAEMRELSIIENGAMLVRGGRVERTGTLAEIETLIGADEVPDEYRARREEYIELVTNEMLPRVASENLAEFCDVFCEGRVFTVEESRRVLEAARKLGLGLRVHADQLSLSGGALLAA